MITLIDYGAGNLHSLEGALDSLGFAHRRVARPEEAPAEGLLLLPGVGHFGAAQAALRATGWWEALPRRVAEGRPLLGICLGLQLLYERSAEGEVECLGLLPGVVRHLTPALGIRVPHMGWNQLRPLRRSPLLDGVGEGDSAYFVHSYAAPVTADTVAACDHGGLFTAVVQRGRHCGAQFRPERSAGTGARILRNFLEMDF